MQSFKYFLYFLITVNKIPFKLLSFFFDITWIVFSFEAYIASNVEAN